MTRLTTSFGGCCANQTRLTSCIGIMAMKTSSTWPNTNLNPSGVPKQPLGANPRRVKEPSV